MDWIVFLRKRHRDSFGTIDFMVKLLFGINEIVRVSRNYDLYEL